MDHKKNHSPKKINRHEVTIHNHHKPHHRDHKNHKNPKPNQRVPVGFPQIFNGNIANLNFDNPNHDLSGYVYREVYIKDSQGNVQSAKEKQFFNSSKEHRHIHVGEDYKK
jgi:hypothetical protein